MRNVNVKQLAIVGLVAILFSGCAKQDNTVKKSDWENDVLWAQDCGMDGLSCCDSETPCFYEQQCCVSPSDPGVNYCADD